jgi:methionyl-tRNA synthetase
MTLLLLLLFLLLFLVLHQIHSQDGNFSEQQFRDTVNACLANNIGNMLNRTLGLLRKYHSGVLPFSSVEAAGEDHPLRQVISSKLKEAEAAYTRWVGVCGGGGAGHAYGLENN